MILLGVFSFACGVGATIFTTQKVLKFSSALLGTAAFLAISFLISGLA